MFGILVLHTKQWENSTCAVLYVNQLNRELPAAVKLMQIALIVLQEFGRSRFVV